MDSIASAASVRNKPRKVWLVIGSIVCLLSGTALMARFVDQLCDLRVRSDWFYEDNLIGV